MTERILIFLILLLAVPNAAKGDNIRITIKGSQLRLKSPSRESPTVSMYGPARVFRPFNWIRIS